MIFYASAVLKNEPSVEGRKALGGEARNVRHNNIITFFFLVICLSSLAETLESLWQPYLSDRQQQHQTSNMQRQRPNTVVKCTRETLSVLVQVWVWDKQIIIKRKQQPCRRRENIHSSQSIKRHLDDKTSSVIQPSICPFRNF